MKVFDCVERMSGARLTKSEHENCCMSYAHAQNLINDTADEIVKCGVYTDLCKLWGSNKDQEKQKKDKKDKKVKNLGMHVATFFKLYPWMHPVFLPSESSAKFKNLNWRDVLSKPARKFMLAMAKELGLEDTYPINRKGLPIHPSESWFKYKNITIDSDVIGENC